MAPLSLKQALTYVKKNLPEPYQPFDLPQLANLCRQGKVTPHYPLVAVVSYDPHPPYKLCTFNGYITSAQFQILLDTAGSAPVKIYNGLSVTDLDTPSDWRMLFIQNWDNTDTVTNHDFNFEGHPYHDGVNVMRQDLLFAKEQLDGFIIGHCFDDLTDPATELKEAHRQITELEALIIEQQKTIEQLTEQAGRHAEAKELRANTKTAVGKLIYTLCQIAKLDISAKKGSVNDIIMKQAELAGAPLSRNFISDWLEIANNAKDEK